MKFSKGVGSTPVPTSRVVATAFSLVTLKSFISRFNLILWSKAISDDGKMSSALY